MKTNTEIPVARADNNQAAVQLEKTGRITIAETDVYEMPDSYVVMLDLPGVSRDNIRVRVDKGLLSVEGDCSDLHPAETSLIHNELERKSFYRELNLGDGIDLDNIDARLEHGVLTIKLFKTEQHKPREIRIQ